MKHIKIDKLGRIVLPIDFRKELEISTQTDLIISCDGEKITIARVGSFCKICGKKIDTLHRLCICGECLEYIKSNG